MKRQVTDLHGLKSLGIQDDLLTLSKIHSITEFFYVNISKQEKIVEIIDRWVLLKEFNDLDSKIK
ncbi:YhjR family protein [Fluoribacter dumoffii]|uniref:Protein of uncharacterized function (DUF2629) n=1 Tax=Fluoribacter dumoffii TaxID=463 RepID=A0A377G7Q8_9GAMM|nr:BcsR/BcsP family cellulose biosynthesis protein [Fluoribacter dumoffii]KTC89740.1 hypothetical protein Ldum_0808 [Fluoribacter dumoffii NY 23]MCW8384935.1 YhjR family protein [Fluoribacter dumoffii]MCW8417996.1 YhjR family protein [Fluoribacter dumoffii]MCW8454162.1 YhjR family protein [Fluoribacter dumoffii]MCW8461764.1 YhjR family protein [Fluoribacter dumoffii]